MVVKTKAAASAAACAGPAAVLETDPAADAGGLNEKRILIPWKVYSINLVS